MIYVLIGYLLSAAMVVIGKKALVKGLDKGQLEPYAEVISVDSLVNVMAWIPIFNTVIALVLLVSIRVEFPWFKKKFKKGQ